MMMNFVFLLLLLLTGCSLFSKNTQPPDKKQSDAALAAQALGIKVYESPTENKLAVKIQFNCQSETYKLRVFKYKLRVSEKVSEKEKELVIEGTQRGWLSPNITVVSL